MIHEQGNEPNQDLIDLSQPRLNRMSKMCSGHSFYFCRQHPFVFRASDLLFGEDEIRTRKTDDLSLVYRLNQDLQNSNAPSDDDVSPDFCHFSSVNFFVR